MRVFVLLLLVASGLAGCRVDVDPAGKACDQTHACQSGELCFEGQCVVPCDPLLGQACTVSTGACAATGIYRCDGLVLSCDAVAGTSAPEVCDGVDNDCNGTADDAMTPPSCELTAGVCASAARTCQGATGWSECSYGPDFETAEARCDRLDNDCDGTPDDVSGCLYTVLGFDAAPGRRDGLGTAARLTNPKYVAADAAGNLYVVDQTNQQLRRVAPDGTTTTFAGTGRCGDEDGPVATAQMCDPWGVAVTPDGSTVYFTEIGNDRIRKVEGGVVTTIAGSGTQGFQDGPAATARFNEPYNIALLPNGDLLIADGHNHRIRRYVAATKQVTTEAGTGTSGNADGTRLAWDPLESTCRHASLSIL